jgi:hypothetical protein
MLAGAIAVSGAVTATNADAAPFFLEGDFTIQIFNFAANGAEPGDRRLQSFATQDSIDDAVNGVSTGAVNTQTINYVGALDFDLTGGDQTIQGFFDTGTKTSMDALTFGANTLSAGGYSTTTLFKITANAFTNIGSMAGLRGIRHDDGVTLTGATGLYDDPAPQTTPLTFTALPDFTGSAADFTLIYAAANGNPSVMQINAIPLPAAAWLLMGVSGALVGAKRRSARKAA